MLRFFTENKIPLVLLFLTWGMVILVYWPQLFYWNDNGDLVAGWRIIWADWALHMAQAQAFAHQPIGHVLANNPIYADYPIAYPFATNLISGLLLRAGLDLVSAMVLPSMVFSLALVLALYTFGKRVTRNATAALTGIFLFFLSGGLEFTDFFFDLQKDFSWQTILYPPEHYSFLEDRGYVWKSVLLASLIPQRSLLMGMPWMLLILNFLLANYFRGFGQSSYRTLLIAGLLAGLLAIIHTYSLLILFVLCGVLFLSDLKNYRYWLIFALGTAITALPCLSLVLTENTQSFIQWLPGWYAHSSLRDEPFLLLWWRNLGLFFPLALIALVWLYSPAAKQLMTRSNSKHQQKLRWLFAGFALLFILANLFRFQPWAWDNTKILLWPIMACGFLVAQLLCRLWQASRWLKPLAPLLGLVCCLSGFIDLMRSSHIHKQSFVMLPKDQLQAGQQLRADSRYDARILAANHHLHFATTASGRGVLMGYSGWLWSYNIAYQQREADIKKIYQGTPEAKTLLRLYGVDYVVIDQQSKKDYKANQTWFDRHYPLLFSSGQYLIYKIKTD